MFWGQVPVPSPGLDESFSSPRGILAAQLLSSSAELVVVGALSLVRNSCKCPTWVRSSILGSSPHGVQLHASA